MAGMAGTLLNSYCCPQKWIGLMIERLLARRRKGVAW